MRKLYTNKALANGKPLEVILFAILVITSVFSSYSQVRVPFTPRASDATPSQSVYSVKGDFTMMGNTNLTLVNYGATTDNNNDMEYVDVDSDSDTWNSSSSTLTFSTENGAAIPECSNIIYAGLYWTGRGSSSETFSVTKNGVTKNFNKREVSIKGPSAGSYTKFTANSNDIYYPSGTDGDMFSAYAEVTDYVKQYGLGEYFVADIALLEGDGGSVGYYGGWGMVVVYENSKMKYRDITIFDGHAYVASFVTADYTIDVNGFVATQNGNVNLRLGVMAGEGDIGVSGDFFEIQRQSDGLYERLNHSTNSTNNFFNSSINTGGNSRNPNLQNNSGIDIAMFDINNTGNSIIDNSQTSTRFRYGSTRDTYIIYNVTFSVDAYIPEPEGVLNITSVNGSAPNPPDILEPGQYSDYTLEIKNTGTEDTDNTVITIPLPDSVNPNNLNITTTTPNPGIYTTTNTPTYETGLGFGSNGSIVWDLGTLPTPPDPDTILATISFRLTVTTDCTMLTSPSFDPNVSLDGTIVGVGATSNVPFNFPLIQGYQTTGLCIGEPIPTPVIIGIDYLDYINEPPTASNPAPIDIECGGTIPPADISVVTDEADNSGIAPIVAFVSDVSDGGSNPEIITRTYSVTDDCGNSINVTQTITIDDNTNPDTPTLADVTGECSATATAPTTNDNCSGSITGTTTDPLTYTTQGTFVINWTFDDGNGNVIVVPQNVIIDDVTDPDTPTLADVTGECSATATAPTTNDNCSGTITGTTTDPLTYTTQGTFVINWTFDDGNGNVIVVPQNVIVDDTTPPATPTLPDLTGECSVTATAPTITDNCNGTVITGTTTDPLTYTTQGTFVINWTFDDGNGNVIVVPQNVIVDDITDPDTPTLADVTGECSATATAPTTNDNCSGSITGTTTDPLTYTTQGTFVINWTFDDGNGNVIVVPQNVIVDDVTNPDTPTLPDLSGECSATATAPTTNDNCSGSITGTTTDPLTYTTQGTFVINWTFDDGNGNVIVVPQNVIVDDVTDPDTPTLADVTGECSATATAPTTNDNCSGTITGTTTNPLTYTTQGTFVINWTFDDGNGNVIVVPQNVIVDDITDPDTPTLADVTGECSATATAPTTNDNCSGSITGTTTDPLTYTTQGTFVINWTFDDGNGNVIVVPQNVIVDDVTNPDTPTLPDLSGECSATATAPTTNDNCSGSITGTTTDPLTYTTQGTFVINWTFDDGNGNVIVVPQNVIVDDVTDPIITCPSDVSVNVDAGLCTASNVDLGTPTTDDNCSVDSVTNDAPTLFPIGDTIVTWTVTDAGGNTATCTQTVTVTDNIDPTITCPADISINVDASSCETSNVDLGTPTTDDNCSVDTVTNDAPATFPLGDTIVTWTVTDGSGNTATCTQTVTVIDNIDPTIICPSDVSVNVDAGSCDASSVNLGTPTTDDNCSVDTVTNDAPTTYPIGDTVVTWTVTDGSGNTATCTQTVTVTDDADPTITCPIDVTVNVDTGLCTASNVDLGTPSVSDCTSVTISNDAPTLFPQGDTIVTWTVTDDAGNSVTCTQVVTVLDNINPTFVETLPADITVECSEVPDAEVLTATDNCGSAEVTFSEQRIDGSCVSNYTLVRTWTATDASGLTTVHTQNITVQDTTRPEFVEDLPGDITVECDAVPSAATLTATDNCSDTTVSINDVIVNGNCANNYVIERTWVATDECGLTTTHTQTITVQDTTAPVPTTTFDETLDVSCVDVPDAPVLEFSDNCSDTAGINVVFEETNSFDENVLADYQIVRTWTVTDECANQEVYTQTLNVSLDEVITEVIGEDRCFDDGIIDLNNLIDSENPNGTWELLEGDPTATLNDNIFDPTVLELSEDFLPDSGGIDYKFRYTTTEGGCISIYELTMNINAECVVLQCGDSDIVISKALTPNGDNYNETFDIAGIDFCGFVAQVKIFNRWGALVYSSDRYTLGSFESGSMTSGDWDGSAPKSSIGNNGKLPNGTYYYIIKLVNEKTGKIELGPLTGPIYLGTK